MKGLMILLGPALLLAGTTATADDFKPPSENIALGKSYRLDPRPNYQYCTDPGDRTQLTDGQYTRGYFWTQASTVGWNHVGSATITLDLGSVQPIRGVLKVTVSEMPIYLVALKGLSADALIAAVRASSKQVAFTSDKPLKNTAIGPRRSGKGREE